MWVDFSDQCDMKEIAIEFFNSLKKIKLAFA
ncbi:hypothetical protein BVI2075_350014 [Burkholderia vietnamiensis]|nr:hypothetical protein BVI2075_350014 [Burkholderia vietnamiensis]